MTGLRLETQESVGIILEMILEVDVMQCTSAHIVVISQHWKKIGMNEDMRCLCIYIYIQYIIHMSPMIMTFFETNKLIEKNKSILNWNRPFEPKKSRNLKPSPEF